MSRRNLLLVSSGHPATSIGGVELYTFDLYQAFRDSDEFDPILLARAGSPMTVAKAPLRIEDQARRTLDNLRQVLELAGSSLDKVVRVNIFLSDEKDFEGLNQVYREFFPDNFPARRTILSPLVGGFRCEIDCTALE